MSESTSAKWSLPKTGAVAALTVLTWVGTMFVRIPIPATTGYFNLGDIFIILAGLLLGGIPGFIVGAVGSTLADAIGYPQFIPATFVTKGCEGLICGLVGGGVINRNIFRKWAGAFSGAATMVGGYFVFEAFVYPWLAQWVPFFKVTTFAEAIVEILPNSIQGTIGAITGVGLWKAMAGITKRRQ